MLEIKNLNPFYQFFHVNHSTVYASPRCPNTFTITMEVPNDIYNKMALEDYHILIVFKPKGE